MNEQWLFKLALSLLCLMKGCYGQAITDNLRMVWNDEFNGNSLNASKWSVPPAWYRQGGCYWSDDNFEMTGNGKVKLSVTESNDGTVYCGAIRTHNKFDKKYGYFETRCTIPQIHGGWAAFWMMPYQNQPGNAGNDGTEIDIFESIDGWKGKIQHALHWDGYGAEHQHESKKMVRPDVYDGQYHVFGMMWTPEEYIFYIDNEETWRTSTAGVSDVNQYLKLTLEVSGQNWAGDWNNQVTKPINWFVDYVRVYDYEPNVNLEFTAVTNDQTFHVGDQVQMHVGVTGTSQIDEIKFFTKKGNEAYVLRKTSDITSQNTYWYNWFPDQAGTYKLEATGFKSGNYVTHVVVSDVSVEETQLLDPLTMTFTSISSGDNYKVGDTVDMSVELFGDLSDADEIQYLTRKDDGEFVVQETQSLTGSSTYEYSWTPTESGTYSLRITAKKYDSYVTHVVVGGVNVEETPTVAPTHAPPTEPPTRAPDPFSMAFTSLNSGENYDIGDAIDMSVELSGDLSGADEIQYLTRKDDGEFVVQETQSLTGLSSYEYISLTESRKYAFRTVDTAQKRYEYRWSPTESGTYAFRITAKKSGSYVTHVVVGGVVVEEAPFNLEYKVLQSGSTYQIGEKVKMHVILSGNYASVNKIKFIVQKIGESGSVINSSVIKTATVAADTEIYYKKWTSSEAGYYRLKVSAYLDDILVDYVKENVTIK